MKKIGVFGATGRLGASIVKHMASEGVDVVACVRNVAKAERLLPKGISLVQVDLADVNGLKDVLGGLKYVYLNLSSSDPNAAFVPEYHGIANILEASHGTSVEQIIQISGLGAIRPDFHVNNEMFFTNAIRLKGFELFKNSKIAHTKMHASWFLDALPWFIKDHELVVYGDHAFPLYWTNTIDFADQMIEAIGNKRTYNADLIIQGKEALTMTDAATIYADIHDKMTVSQAPIIKELGKFGKLMHYFEDYREELVADETWSLVGEPKLTAESFIRNYL